MNKVLVNNEQRHQDIISANSFNFIVISNRNKDTDDRMNAMYHVLKGIRRLMSEEITSLNTVNKGFAL